MCGIAGYFGPKQPSKSKIDKCLALMQNRGPDSHGVFKEDKITLLSSRLSIIDLTPAANQPFVSDRFAMVFNGELYNSKEIKETHRLKSSGDTDTIFKFLSKISKFETHRFSDLSQCEGMWAFAFYDRLKKTLFLSRDRFGEKPLYIHCDQHKGVYFASEIKYIFALSGYHFETNYQKVYNYVAKGYRSLFQNRKETFFKGIEEVKPATYLSFCDKGDKICNEYFNAKYDFEKNVFDNYNCNYDFDSCVKNIRSSLINSVKIRLRSDVPIAFCLSGGIDSCSVISIAKKIYNYDVCGFTVEQNDEKYNEMGLIKKIVNELGLKHVRVKLTKENFFDNISKIISYHSAPLVSASYYAHWLLMQQVQNHGYKVCISGTGGDELFAGYYDHYLYFFNYLQKNGMKQSYEFWKDWQKYVKPNIRNLIFRNIFTFIDNPNFRKYLYLNKKYSNFLNRDFVNSYKFEHKETRFIKGDILKNRMLAELFAETVPPILHDDDLNAMYFSIENRSPFLDSGLFKNFIESKTNFFIKNGYNKHLLRTAMKGIVPDAVLNERKKVGFNAPISEFIDLNDDEIREWLFEEKSIVWNIYNRKKFLRFDYSNIGEELNKFLFNFINIKMFLEKF